MVHTITVNTTDYELRRAREEALGVFGSLDAGRPNSWAQYGYKETLTFADFLQAYDRGGPGHGAVHRILDKCWQENPRIKAPASDKETHWEAKVKDVLTSINGWQKLRDLDRRNMVGRYAAVIYRVADNKLLNEPLALGTKLVDLVPVYESQIRVLKWNEDVTSQDYGKVEMFELETAPPTQDVGQFRPKTWLRVHPSRVQILAEGAVGDNFLDGVPLLKAGFNNLVDLEKIGGGSAESFLKNSARAVVYKFESEASPEMLTRNPDGSASGSTVREVIEDQTRALNRNQESAIVTQGADVSTLQTTVSDPTGAFNLAANLFAASVQIPFTILFGQQTGRLASDEDKADMVARCTSRQRNELTPMLVQLITRLQACGVVKEGEFEIEWPALDAPGDTEKLDNAAKLASINKTNSEAGQTATFDGNEIRKTAGFEERDELAGLPLEGDPADDEPGTGGAPAAPAPAPRAALRQA